MIIVKGDKTKFAICVQFCEIDFTKKVAWGGFELWLNNTRFGDIYYFDLITGNNYSLITDIMSKDMPVYPFDRPLEASVLLKEIYSFYSGNNQEESKSIQESYISTVYWGSFILLPNGRVPFDRTKLVYFGDKSTVNFVYNNNIDTGKAGIEFSMPASDFKDVAKEFVDFYESVMAGQISIDVVDKGEFH